MLPLTLLVAVALPASASAATWLPVENLSAAGEEANEPDVAFDAAGNALAVWHRNDAGAVRIQDRFRPAGGSFGSVQNLSFPGVDAIRGQVAFDATGNALVAWRRTDGASDRVQARMRLAGGSLGALQNLAVGAVTDPHVAMDPAGNALALWARDDGADFRVEARFSPAGGAFAGAQTLSAAGLPASREQVAFDAAGNALVVWLRPNQGNAGQVQARFRPAGGAFGGTQNLSVAGNTGAPQFDMDPTGDALAVWSRHDGVRHRIQARFRPAGGVFGATQTLSPADTSAGSPQVALDAAGNALVAWQRSGVGASRIEVRDRLAGGGLGTTEILSGDGGDAEPPQVAVDPAGNALVVWVRDDGANTRVQGRFRPAGGSFGPVQTLSAAGQDADDPQVAFDSAGNALAVWSRNDGANDRVQARFLRVDGDGALPSNDFSFGKLKRNKKRGTGKQTVIVPGSGELELAKTKRLKPANKRAEAAGKVKLRIKPRRNAKRRLSRKGKAKLKANVTYTPDGGDPNTKSKKLKLKKRV